MCGWAGDVHAVVAGHDRVTHRCQAGDEEADLGVCVCVCVCVCCVCARATCMLCVCVVCVCGRKGGRAAYACTCARTHAHVARTHTYLT